MPPPSAGSGPRLCSTSHELVRRRWQIPPTTQLACDARASCVVRGADGRAGSRPCACVWSCSPASSTVGPVLSRPLALVSAVLAGVLTGGMVLIDVVRSEERRVGKEG